MRRFGLTLCLASFFACAVLAEDGSAESAETTKLEVKFDARGGAEVSLKMFERQPPSPLAATMGQVLGCAFENPKDKEVAGGWVFAGRCAGAFRKRGLLVGGQIEFAPLMEVLKHANVERVDVTIRHPRTGFSRFTENGWTFDSTAQSFEYTRTMATSALPERVRLAFGYRPVNFLPISLLLFPVGLTMVMRWAALRARNTDPVVVWFTYWRLFGWVIMGAWLIWVQGSTVLDCAALARFLLNDSPYALLLQVAFYVVPPILVQFLCTLTSGAVLAQISGEKWMLPVSVKHAFWHEPVTTWPLLCLLAGVASLALYNEVLLGIACLAIAYAGHVGLVWLWLRLQNFDRYELPAGELRSRVLELAARAGMKLKQIYLLPAAEGRLSGPYMVRRGRLFLSDALLRALRRRDTEAVLAREFVHVRRHHREILVVAAAFALPLIYRFSHLPAIAGSLPWAVRGPLLVWLTPVFLYLLWRRFERGADVEALEITGDGEALSAAIPKIAQFNVLGCYWRRFEGRFLGNGSMVAIAEPLEVIGVRDDMLAAPADSKVRAVSCDSR